MRLVSCAGMAFLGCYQATNKFVIYGIYVCNSRSKQVRAKELKSWEAELSFSWQAKHVRVWIQYVIVPGWRGVGGKSRVLKHSMCCDFCRVGCTLYMSHRYWSQLGVSTYRSSRSSSGFYKDSAIKRLLGFYFETISGPTTTYIPMWPKVPIKLSLSPSPQPPSANQ